MPPRPPARAQSTSRTPPTHTPSASATPSSSSPVDLGQPTTSAIEGVQPSPRYGVLRGHTPAREIPPPPVPMHASPSIAFPSVLTDSRTVWAIRPFVLHRLLELRDTPQPEEPAQTPNVAAVPTESRGTTDSESASVSDEQRVPEAAPVRNTSIPLAAFVPDELQDATATPSHVLAEWQDSAAPEPSHVISASWEAPEPSHILSASQETITPESSHVPDALREAAAPESFHVPDASPDAVGPEALRDAVAPEPSHVLSASRDTAALGSSHVPDTSQEAAVPEQFHVPDASLDAVAPKLSHVPDASRDAAALEPSHSEPSHVPKPSHESQGAAYVDQAHIRDAPRTPDSSDSEEKMDTDSIQQDEIVASDPLERDTFPLIYVSRFHLYYLNKGGMMKLTLLTSRLGYHIQNYSSARHFTATYRRLLALDPSDHMGDLIERTTILMGIILDFHTDLSYIRDGLSKHRQSHEQKTSSSS
ncbi:hypothetical protein EDB85DRAFT_1900853 [Lactarius pseudohatsudake]|nr:hypothetical protein EDB85DRAFT_1900853 [Lactarius pseudohatsudake]